MCYSEKYQFCTIFQEFYVFYVFIQSFSQKWHKEWQRTKQKLIIDWLNDDVDGLISGN